MFVFSHTSFLIILPIVNVPDVPLVHMINALAYLIVQELVFFYSDSGVIFFLHGTLIPHITRDVIIIADRKI